MATIEVYVDPKEGYSNEVKMLSAIDDLIQLASDMGDDELASRFQQMYFYAETRVKHIKYVTVEEYLGHLKLVK
jgi:hypothetical protein